jgi:AraC-like DNA-binding protein
MTDPSLRGMEARTVADRRRLYLLVRLVVKRHYAKHLTLPVLAKALATSPRQIQRAYAQFGDCTFQDDLIATRMEAAAELLHRPIKVRDLAREVGYRQPSHFAKAFRRCHGVSPSTYRAQLRRARATDAVEPIAA